MKTTCNLLVGILISVFWGSCASEEAEPEHSDKGRSAFYIYTNNSSADTRTVMDGSGAVQWLANNRINVNGVVNTETTIGWNGGTGTRFGFATAPTPEGGYYYAVYPAVATDGTSNVWQPGSTKFRVKLPQEQRYKDAVSFADNVNLSVAWGETNQLLFYNVGGVVKVTLGAAGANDFYGIKKIRFISNPGKPVSGTGTVDAYTTKLTLDPGQPETVDLVFDTPSFFTNLAPLSFLWCLPVNTYEAGWKIQIFDESDLLMGEVTGTEQLKVQRAKMTTINSVVRVEKHKYKIRLFRIGVDDTLVEDTPPMDKFVGVDFEMPRRGGSRVNYFFLGWALTPDATSPLIREGDTVSDALLGYSGADVTLYPAWKMSFFDCTEGGLSTTTEGIRRLPIIYVSGSGNSAKLMLTGDPTNSAALFQYGSVIAWNPSANAIYNPSISGSSTWNSSWMPSKNVEHTNDGLKAAEGDPCRLVGMTVSEIQTALNAGQTPDNGIWRLPTRAENSALGFYGWQTASGVKGVSLGRYFEFMPTEAAYLNTDGAYGMDYGGWWYGGWSSNNENGEGWCYKCTHGYSFSSSYYIPQSYAITVRCVRQ